MWLLPPQPRQLRQATFSSLPPSRVLWWQQQLCAAGRCTDRSFGQNTAALQSPAPRELLPPAPQVWGSPVELLLWILTGFSLKFSSGSKSRTQTRISKVGAAGLLSTPKPPHTNTLLSSCCCRPNQHWGFNTVHPPASKYSVFNSFTNTYCSSRCITCTCFTI